MKKLLLMVGVALGVLTAGSSAKAYGTYDPDNKYPAYNCHSEVVEVHVTANYYYTEAYKLVDLINDYREENGQDRLSTNDNLMKIAMYRAMQCNVDFEHDGLVGGHVSEAIRGAGFGDSYVGIHSPYSFNEAIHWGSNTAEQALDGWKNSPPHNEFILHINDAAKDQQFAIGVGFVNQTAVACIFSKEEVVTIATDSRSLSNYATTEVVPLLKARYEAGVNENGYGIPNETWACTVIDPKTGQPVDEEEEEEKKEEKKVSSESKTVKAAKVSGVKVSRKKAGKYTKLTVKFSKVKKVKGIKYQVQVAKNKKFKSAKKATTSSTKKTFSINYKGKKAYIRVRCYKKINGKTVYGKWSSIKTIKTYK